MKTHENIPDKRYGIWCDNCHRKLRPVEMVDQYYDSSFKLWRGKCRLCFQEEASFWRKHYHRRTMSETEFHRSVYGKIGSDVLLNFYDNETFLFLDYVPRCLHSVLIERFGSLENYYLERSKMLPTIKLEELPL